MDAMGCVQFLPFEFPQIKSTLVTYTISNAWSDNIWVVNYVRLRAVSLFSVVRRAKRETRKWPRACFARLVASPLSPAYIALNKSEEKERLLAV